MPKGNRIGSKLSVLSRGRSKKRSGFKGIPKWKNEAKKRQPKDVSEIAFIPDSDVGRDSDVSETGNIPVSASRRKLDVDVDVEVDSEEEYEFKDTKGSAAGYRLVYIESLRDLVQRIHTDSCEGEIIYPPICPSYFYSVSKFAFCFLIKLILNFNFLFHRLSFDC